MLHRKKVDDSKISRSHLLALGQNDSKPQNQHSVRLFQVLSTTQKIGAKLKDTVNF